MSYEPMVSVIIPTYNIFKYLPEAIESVLGQDYERKEVIVVDDGSPREGAAEAVAPYGERVRFFRTENGGGAAARNFGVQRSTGDLIALLDHDDRWLPGMLHKQIGVMANPEIGMAHGAIYHFDENGRSEPPNRPYFAGHPLNFHDVLGHHIIPVPTTVFRRRVFDSVGGFSPEFACADWDFCLKVAFEFALHGTELALAEIRSHPGNMGKDLGMLRDELAVLARHAARHGRCRQCEAAATKSREIIRSWHYGKLCLLSSQALAKGHRKEAIKWRMRAMAFDPLRSLRRLPLGLLGRLGGRRPGELNGPSK